MRNRIAAGAQWNTLSFLVALSRQIFQTCRQVIRPYGPPWPSDQTLSAQEGSCRDLAVLFCDACRVMGIAARFVSGYECASASTALNNQDSYMHAWAEVYLPGIGWRGLRSRARSGGIERTRRGGRGLRSRSRVAGGRLVFGWISVADGGFAQPAGGPCRVSEWPSSHRWPGERPRANTGHGRRWPATSPRDWSRVAGM